MSTRLTTVKTPKLSEDKARSQKLEPSTG